jgi:hypothetical protein
MARLNLLPSVLGNPLHAAKGPGLLLGNLLGRPVAEAAYGGQRQVVLDAHGGLCRVEDVVAGRVNDLATAPDFIAILVVFAMDCWWLGSHVCRVFVPLGISEPSLIFSMTVLLCDPTSRMT